MIQGFHRKKEMRLLPAQKKCCCCHCKDLGRLLLSEQDYERLLLSLQGCCCQSKENKMLLVSLQGLGKAAAVRAKNKRGC